MLLFVGLPLPSPLAAEMPGSEKITSSRLLQPWVKKGAIVDSTAIQLMLQLFSEDQASNQVLEQVASKMGAIRLADVFSVIHFINEPLELGEAETHPGKMTVHQIFNEWDGSEDNKARAYLKLERDNYFSYKIERNPISIQIKTAKAPCILMHSDRTLIESFGNLLHELVHILAEFEPHEPLDVTAFHSTSELISGMLLQKGGEFDAYREGTSGYLRAKKKYKLKVSTPYDRYFDSGGKLADSDGLKSEILGDDFYGGYIGFFKAEARKQVRNQLILQKLKQANLLTNRYKIQDSISAFKNYLSKSGLDSENRAEAEKKLEFFEDFVQKLEAEIETTQFKMTWITDHYSDIFK